MRGAWTAVLGLVVWACGGRVEADTQTPALLDASTGVDAAAETGMDAAAAIVDASSRDTSSEIECAPTANDPSGCSGDGYCVAWVPTDAGAPTLNYPANVVRSACESGTIGLVCDGKWPVSVKDDPYTNLPDWAVCVEP
jgi:hypothetical protein